MFTILKKAITDTIDSATEDPADGKDNNGIIPGQLKQRKNWIIVDLALLLIKIFIVCIEAFFKLLLPPYEKPLYNEVVLVTGSGGGIGRSIAVKFAEHGATIVCLDKNEEANKETEAIIKATGSQRVYAYTCDVANRENVQEKCRLIQEEVGHVTVLINNAGILKSKQFSSQTNDDVTNTFAVNVFAQFWTLECILPNMRKYNHGHIVALCSMCGITAIPNLTAYCASKFAVRGLMDGLYEELRAENPGNQIKFTTIYPYMVNTGLVSKPRTRFPEMFKLLTPEEVADQTVKAVRQDIKELSIPSNYLSTFRFFRFLPSKMVELLTDFVDTGVDPDD